MDRLLELFELVAVNGHNNARPDPGAYRQQRHPGR